MADPTHPHRRRAQVLAVSTGHRPAKSQRRRARELALQGLYQWLVAGGDADGIDAQLREHESYAKCDGQHFDALLRGSIEQAAVLDAALAKHVDRKTTELSPVEHGC